MMGLLASVMVYSVGVQKPIPEWVPPFVEQMKATGMLVGYPDGLLHRRGPNRYEHAVEAHAAYMHLKQEAPKVTDKEPIDSPRLKWWIHIDGLVDMFAEFRVELASMGVTAAMDKQAVKELRSFQSKLAAIGAGGNVGPDWVTDVAVKLKGAGLLVGFPDLSGHHYRPLTRYEWAVCAHASYMHLKNMSTEPNNDKEPPGTFAGWPDRVDDLTRLFREFRQELTAMQIYEQESPAAFRNELQRLRRTYAKLSGDEKPFADVPAAHWAARAIRDLKKESLIKGYPGGRFGG